jgi:hypothetical protein
VLAPIDGASCEAPEQADRSATVAVANNARVELGIDMMGTPL